jgi:hypothetical protein
VVTVTTTFTSSGTLNTSPLEANRSRSPGTDDYLVVAGGGGGSPSTGSPGTIGGGGGAGGYRTSFPGGTKLINTSKPNYQ